MSVITPKWPLPKGVQARLTTREASHVAVGSDVPFESFNLALHVDDDAASVQQNRQSLIDTNDSLQHIQWLQQVHGVECIEASCSTEEIVADASYSRQSGVACAVMTADCLPVLFADDKGQQVAAAHAGWRGLVDGVLASSVESFSAKPSKITAYLGPAIGPKAFEVGLEVLEQFFGSARNEQHLSAISKSFTASSRPLHFYTDLYALARAELQALGVTAIYGGDYCTYSDSERFYSYRRQKKTGRMASVIWLE